MAYAMLNRRLEKMAKNTDCPFISAEAGRMELLETAEVDAIQARADYKNWKTALTTMEQELRRAVEFGFNKEELAEAAATAFPPRKTPSNPGLRPSPRTWLPPSLRARRKTWSSRRLRKTGPSPGKSLKT